MQKIPQVVRDRLKAGSVAAGHPDADILTAFAERSLLDRERQIVLSHLSACADCRDIILLASPPGEVIAPASFSFRKPWFTWSAFRWGFAAAGVALIAIGAVEFEHRKSEVSSIASRQLAAAPVVAMQNQPASQNAAPVARPITGASSVHAFDKTAIAAEQKAHKALGSESRAHAGLRLQLQTAPPAQSPSPAPVATQVLNPPIPATSQTVEVQTEMVQVESAAPPVNVTAIPNSFTDQSSSYNTGSLSRAKPAIAPVTANASGIVPTARWSITAVGSLQRSFDQGKTWQDVSVDANASPAAVSMAFAEGAKMKATPPKKDSVAAQPALKNAPVFFRTVAAAGTEVWAGGSNAALFHSVDGGVHWTRVLPSSAGIVLTGDIVSVDFSDSQHGILTTSTPEIWTTRDGGQTWQKQ